MDIEQWLLQAAIELIERRYPTGWGGAAAIATGHHGILTSVAPETINASTELCIETGAILEAHKWKATITHSLCVVRDHEHERFKILTPCGICQERLFYWGAAVKAAVTTPDGNLQFKTLAEIQPYHWHNAYKNE
jgi:cytidine deaminase